jgi:adenylate cyclase
MRAYDLFLKAFRLAGSSFTPEALAQVETLYRQVLAVDPTFARAYSGLAYIQCDRSIDVIAGVRHRPDEQLLAALHLAERALALDRNDPRVHSSLGLMCAQAREFERAERHIAFARAMNPNDAMVQIFWAWVQGMRGRPERGIPPAEMAYRLNPQHPPWYNMVLGRLRFQLGDYSEAATLLERVVTDAPARHLRNMGWRVAADAHLGRVSEAVRLGEELVSGIASHWHGDPAAGPSEYMDWIVWSSLLERTADVDGLRAGLRSAGLPA